jgi:hypothetical protein
VAVAWAMSLPWPSITWPSAVAVRRPLNDCARGGEGLAVGAGEADGVDLEFWGGVADPGANGGVDGAAHDSVPQGCGDTPWTVPMGLAKSGVVYRDNYDAAVVDVVETCTEQAIDGGCQRAARFDAPAGGRCGVVIGPSRTARGGRGGARAIGLLRRGRA